MLTKVESGEAKKALTISLSLSLFPVLQEIGRTHDIGFHFGQFIQKWEGISFTDKIRYGTPTSKHPLPG